MCQQMNLGTPKKVRFLSREGIIFIHILQHSFNGPPKAFDSEVPNSWMVLNGKSHQKMVGF